MESNLISVVVPVYNAENTLQKCVDSIRQQTYEHVQIVLVNDGSKDSSLDMCREFEKLHNNIKVVDKLNEGVSETRNKGIAEADGEYIIFVDSDDYIDKDMCKDMMQHMEEEDADVCMCSMTLHKEGKEITKPLSADKMVLDTKETIARELISIYKTTYVNSPCNKLYKKELITELFSKDISLGEDLLFNLKYLENCNRAVLIDKGYYHYQFVNGGSLTQQYREDNFEIADRLYEAVTNYGKKYNVTFENMIQVREVFMNSIFYAIQDLIYYCKKDKKYKQETLKAWANNPHVIETVNNAGAVSSQHRIVARLLAGKHLFLVRRFFGMKKLISSLKH